MQKSHPNRPATVSLGFLRLLVRTLAPIAMAIVLCWFWLGPLQAAEPPSSARSKNAIARVKPILTNRLTEKNLAWGSPVFIRIFKQERLLELWLERDDRFVLFKTYPICTFSGRLGPKLAEGDLQAPEGFYSVKPNLMNPWSRFHLSFNIGYPNRYDRSLGRTGSYIMVHGNCVSTGCFAMTDPAIEEIYALVDAAMRHGQGEVPVHIFPFRMTTANLTRHHDATWIEFWQDLKKGYDAFEPEQRPPHMVTQKGRYILKR